jgi:hypothetical protein
MVPYLEAKGTSRECDMDLGIETKSGAEDFCTKVDVENENMIMDGIRRLFPKHDIIGEEAVGTGEIPLLKKEVPTWIIDPIGTSYVRDVDLSGFDFHTLNLCLFARRNNQLFSRDSFPHLCQYRLL